MLGFGSKKIKELNAKLDAQALKLESFFGHQYELFDGEKSEGELGAVKTIFPDYYSARERAWELQLTSDVAKLVVNKWVTWQIGKGLRFNATPPKQGKIKGINSKKLVEDIEFRFRNYMNSNYCDYSSMVNFHVKAKEAAYNSKVAGDILCILRVEKGRVTIQLIDGANVQTPINYSGDNSILDGVEYDSRGKHVAYHIYNDNLEYQRISAIHEQTGLRMAFLVYGSKFRLNETRGLPMLIGNFEKIKNIERYVDATVKNAEISSEMILVNEHDNSSTGENVFKSNALKALAGTSNNDVGELPNASCFKNNLVKLTKGVALNNTVGGKLKMLKPDAEGTMPDFLVANLKLVFGSENLPYEVAMSVYNSNYSASRAAIKDWEHNLKVDTDNFAIQFYQPFYELWLYNEVLSGNIICSQLIEAYTKKDYVNIVAINKAMFTGASVPSIDPLKEINAVRRAMGDEITPLMTGEKGAEMISQQDYSEIQEQVIEERKIAVKQIKNEEI